MRHDIPGVPPELLELTSRLGANIPPSALSEISRRTPRQLVAFSDYSFAEGAAYETYATWIVDYAAHAEHAKHLHQLRDRHGIGNRTIDYKRRKDKKRLPILSEWVQSFAELPSLCIVLCWHRSLRAKMANELKAKQEQLRQLGSGLKINIANEVVRKISFLAVLAPLLRSTDQLLWVTDDDPILQGTASEVLPLAIETLARQTMPGETARLGYARPLTEEFELMLTLPDLAAGAIGEILPAAIGDTAKAAPGSVATSLIVNGLTHFAPADATASAERGLLLIAAIEAEANHLRYRTIRLTHVVNDLEPTVVSTGLIP